MAKPAHIVTRSALALLLAVWLLWAPLTTPATAAPTSGRCLLSARSECVNNLAAAHAADDEEVGDEAEAEQAEEELASAEEREEAEEAEEVVEAEKANTTTPATPGHSGGLHSSHEAHRNAPIVSHLALSPKATTALKHGKPSASAVRFAFTLSAPAKVHVTLVRQTNSGGHKHWRRLPDSIVTIVAKGHRSRGLTGHNRLSPGRYRLTVKPVNGRSRSIYLNTSR